MARVSKRGVQRPIALWRDCECEWAVRRVIKRGRLLMRVDHLVRRLRFPPEGGDGVHHDEIESGQRGQGRA